MSQLTPQTRDKLKAVSTATICTALYKRGLRNSFIQDVRPLNPDAGPMVGEAFTLRYIPAREDLNPLSVFEDRAHPQRKAIEECPPGAVFVIDSRKDARAASAGSILVARLMARAVAGIVTDGGFRDSPEIAKLSIPAYYHRPSAPTNLTRHQAIDINAPIACGDVPVFPGDVLVGDAEGVVVIPAGIVDEVADEATRITEFETFVTREVHAGRSILGLYPATDPQAQLDFAAWQKANKLTEKKPERPNMSERIVRGVHLNYRVIGDTGSWIALTPGGRRPYDELVDFASRLAASGYSVLLHDRRNCGASDVAFDNSASEHEIWADDLHDLGRQLNAFPMYVGGSSAGARLAILYALRHPQSLKGLLLWRVTGGKEAVDRLAESYYGQFIKAAHRGGMAAVCETQHFRECINARPSNRERLLQTDQKRFIEVMTSWRERFLQSATLPVVGATEQNLRSITVPVCVIGGNDVIHTPAAARNAASLMPNSELHDDVVEKRSEGNLLQEWDRNEWRGKESNIAEIFNAFVRRTEM